MSRKDYIAAARLIADEVEAADTAATPALERIARGLADLFAADNGRFDRGRFYFACALDDNGRVER